MNAFSFHDAVEDLATSHRRLFEESSVAIHEIDRQGIIRCVNQAECRLLGYAPHELIDHYAWEFVAAEHRETVRAGIVKKLTREQPIKVFIREFRRVDGTYLWMEIHEALIENAAGEVTGIRSSLLDVTERHQLETESQRQHDRMRCLLRSWTRGIVTADTLGHIDFMNPAAEALTGWPQKDAFRHPLEAICRVLDDCGQPVDLMSCILEGPASCNSSGQSLMVDRTGARLSVRWTTSPIRNDNGVIIGAALALEKY